MKKLKRFWLILICIAPLTLFPVSSLAETVFRPSKQSSIPNKVQVNKDHQLIQALETEDSFDAKNGEISSDLLERLLTGSGEYKGFSKRFEIKNASIKGLELPFGVITTTILFQKCKIKRVNFSHAHINHAYFSGCTIDHFVANHATFNGNLYLANLEFVLVDLFQATIGGSLILTGAKNNDEKRKGILRLSHCNIMGAAVFNDLNLHGGLHLTRASIGQSLWLQDAKIMDDNVAINAECIHVGKSILIRHDFRSTGLVTFNSAKVVDNIECWKSSFANKKKDALTFVNATVSGAFVLQESNIAGSINLSSSQIDGAARIDNCTITSTKKRALRIAASDLGRNAIVKNVKIENGGVDLSLSSIKGSLIVQDLYMNDPNWTKFDIKNTTIGKTLDITNLNVNGMLEATCAKIEDNAYIYRCNIKNQNNSIALDCSNITVGTNLHIHKSNLNGSVGLNQARIGKTISVYGGEIRSPMGGIAIKAESLNVGQHAIFDAEFRPYGGMDISESSVAQDLRIYSESPSPEYFLDLGNVKAKTFCDIPAKAWPGAGMLILNGFEYERLNPSQDIGDRLDWLSRMKGFAPQPYVQLASVLAKEGHYDKAEEILIRKDELETERKSWYLRYPLMLYSLLTKHGYAPERAVIGLLAVWLFGFGVYRKAKKWGCMVPENDKDNAPSTPAFHPLMYSLDITIPIINLKQAQYWLPISCTGHGSQTDAPLSKKRLFIWGFFWIHTILGWLLLSVALLSLTAKSIKG